MKENEYLYRVRDAFDKFQLYMTKIFSTFVAITIFFFFSLLLPLFSFSLYNEIISEL